MLCLWDTQWPNSGLFLQNALVEYIGVYSDTKNGIMPEKANKYLNKFKIQVEEPAFPA